METETITGFAERIADYIPGRPWKLPLRVGKEHVEGKIVMVRKNLVLRQVFDEFTDSGADPESELFLWCETDPLEGLRTKIETRILFHDLKRFGVDLELPSGKEPT